MAAQYPGALPSFTSMVGTSTDPLSTPGLPTFATKVADEIVARAQDKALGVNYASGLWYPPEMGTVGNAGYGTGTLILSRWDFPPGTTVVQLGEWLVTAGTAGALRRLCIYNDDGTGYPGSLLKDGGTIATDAGTGSFLSVTAFTAVNVSGTKWLGGVSTVAVSTPATVTSQGRTMGLATVAAGNAIWGGFTQSGVTGALPDPFTTSRATTTSAPRTFVKIG